MEQLGQLHGDGATPAHDLAELRLIHAQQLGTVFLAHTVSVEIVLDSGNIAKM